MRLIGAGGPASRADDPGDDLPARLTALAPSLDGEPDPEWEGRTRARLVAMAAVRTPEAASPPRRSRRRLSVGLAGAAAAGTAVAAVVALSADARPGDALYGFKRGAEQTQLALAGDARGRTLLGFASTRLQELSVVLSSGPSADLVADTLATMDAETSDGAAWLARRALDTGSGAPLQELAGWTAAQAAELDDVRSEIPAAADGNAADSAQLLIRIEERVAALETALGCPAGPATDGSDALGPVPGTCSASAPPADAPTGSDPGQPGTPAVPAPGGSAAPTTAPGDGTVSGPGEDPAIPQLDPKGPDRTDLPLPDLPVPDLPVPDLPVPDLPTLFPGPEGTVRPPAPGSPARTLPLPDVDACLPDLPVPGDC